MTEAERYGREQGSPVRPERVKRLRSGHITLDQSAMNGSAQDRQERGAPRSGTVSGHMSQDRNLTSLVKEQTS